MRAATVVMVAVALALLGLGVAIAATDWATAARRARLDELDRRRHT